MQFKLIAAIMASASAVQVNPNGQTYVKFRASCDDRFKLFYNGFSQTVAKYDNSGWNQVIDIEHRVRGWGHHSLSLYASNTGGPFGCKVAIGHELEDAAGTTGQEWEWEATSAADWVCEGEFGAHADWEKENERWYKKHFKKAHQGKHAWPQAAVASKPPGAPNAAQFAKGEDCPLPEFFWAAEANEAKASTIFCRYQGAALDRYYHERPNQPGTGTCEECGGTQEMDLTVKECTRIIINQLAYKLNAAGVLKRDPENDPTDEQPADDTHDDNLNAIGSDEAQATPEDDSTTGPDVGLLS